MRDASPANLERGTVKAWLSDKCFGFIQSDDRTAEDAFVHKSALEEAGIGELVKGMRVEFTRMPGRDGRMKARNLRVLD